MPGAYIPPAARRKLQEQQQQQQQQQQQKEKEHSKSPSKASSSSSLKAAASSSSSSRKRVREETPSSASSSSESENDLDDLSSDSDSKFNDDFDSGDDGFGSDSAGDDDGSDSASEDSVESMVSSSSSDDDRKTAKSKTKQSSSKGQPALKRSRVEESSSSVDKTAPRRKVGAGSDIYGDQIARKSSAQDAEVVSLEKEEESPEYQQALRRARALVNRLGRANLEPLSIQFAELYRSSARRRVSLALAACVLDAEMQVISTLAVADGETAGTGLGSAASAAAAERSLDQAALIAVLTTVIGPEVAGVILERTAEQFRRSWEQQAPGCVVPLRLLANFYNLRIVSSPIVFDVVDSIVDRFSPLDVELVVALMNTCGRALRRDDPRRLKDLITTAQRRAFVDGDAGRSEDHGASLSRSQFMLQTLYDLKNNRQKTGAGFDEAAAQLRKHTATLISKQKGTTQEPPLGISWKELCTADSKGRWWVVGSAWAGATEDQPSRRVASTATSQISKQHAQALELARKHHMNTELRRSIFVSLTTATDPADAHVRLSGLSLTKHQEATDAVPILLYLAACEKTYNPFYAEVATLLASQRTVQFALRCAFWDRLKLIQAVPDNAKDDDDRDDSPNTLLGNERQKGDAPMPLTHIANLARLLGQLFRNGSLSLVILKTVDWLSMGPYAVLFMRQCFLTLLDSDHGVEAVGRLARHDDDATILSLKEGLAHFLKQHRGHLRAKDTIDEAAKTYLKYCRSAIKILERSLISFG